MRRGRHHFWLPLLCFVLVGAIAVAWFHTKLADAAARLLVLSEVPEKSDLIYLLGGNYSVRAPFAAALFRQGWAPKILISREVNGRRGRENFSDITQQILVQNGVPTERIVQFAPGKGVRSTADEARALRLYLETYPASRVIVVTSAFHSRRARMAISRAVPSTTHVLVVAVTDPDCVVNNWKTTAHCREEVTTEWEKLVFYFFTFLG